jgi:hypothetical protein
LCTPWKHRVSGGTPLLTINLDTRWGGGEWSASVDGRFSPDNKAPEPNEE